MKPFLTIDFLVGNNQLQEFGTVHEQTNAGSKESEKTAGKSEGICPNYISKLDIPEIFEISRNLGYLLGAQNSCEIAVI